MPSVTINSSDLEKEGPILEVQFLISSDLEKKYIEEKKAIPEPITVKSLIDTGASACVIKKEIPEALGLKPTGVTKINTPSSKDHECYHYFMRMLIPSHGLIYEGPFISAPLEGQEISSLIGRDVLKNGILIYIGYMNQFTFSLF
ncbi:hypothetical protein J4405_05600 [Candidatus Woesearchaeota archaeon]|nr:hypothetical protein [Candidatus Woesearchaeota archaeon]